MNLTVNGKQTVIDGKDFLSVTELLGELKVTQPEHVTVEVNGEILDRGDFDTVVVNDGHKVEFLYLMGGGQ